jgi:hypothetical protein
MMNKDLHYSTIKCILSKHRKYTLFQFLDRNSCLLLIRLQLLQVFWCLKLSGMIILLIILINLVTILILINIKISLWGILKTMKTLFSQWCHKKISKLRNYKISRIYNCHREIWAHIKYFSKFRAKIMLIHTLILIKNQLHNIRLETYKVWLNLYLIHQF